MDQISAHFNGECPHFFECFFAKEDPRAQILALVPPWTRIYRIQRDIPMPLVSSGVEHGNVRQLVLKRMKELGMPCRWVCSFSRIQVESQYSPFKFGCFC